MPMNSDNYIQEFSKVCAFLKRYQKIWSFEILNTFPGTLDAYNADWISELNKLSEEDQWHFECRNLPDHFISQSLIKELQAIESIPVFSVKESKRYPTWAFQKVGGKKKHEIEKICSYLDNYRRYDQKLNLIDIGGGAGHLGRILSLYHGHHVLSLDCNEQFQDLGRKRLSKYPHPDGAGSLTFKPHHFGQESYQDRALFEGHDLSLGLHTCGPLALSHLEQSLSGSTKILNVGCCYNKLGKSEKPDTLLSLEAQKDCPPLSNHALTLATRGQSLITLTQYQLKKRVKYYRAALHLFLLYEYGITKFQELGSSLPALYRQNFSTYAAFNIEKLSLKEVNLNSLSKKKMESFYHSTFVKQQLDQIFGANLIRWQFSRTLEKAILYDRLLWLRNNGVQASLGQLFDPLISPRNVAIICK